MELMYIFIVAAIYIAILLFTARFFYLHALKLFSKKLSKKLKVELLDLDYSFEQMIYFVSLPSNLPIIRNAPEESITIELDYRLLFFPKLSGVKVFVKSEMETMYLAYLSIHDFRLPALDQMLEQGKIDDDDYLKMSAYMVSHPSVLLEMKEEVYKQIQFTNDHKSLLAEGVQ